MERTSWFFAYHVVREEVKGTLGFYPNSDVSFLSMGQNLAIFIYNLENRKEDEGRVRVKEKQRSKFPVDFGGPSISFSWQEERSGLPTLIATIFFILNLSQIGPGVSWAHKSKSYPGLILLIIVCLPSVEVDGEAEKKSYPLPQIRVFLPC